MVESEYEKIRLKRVEENKKRMIELNLNNLSQSLRLSSPSPKPSPVYPLFLSLLISFVFWTHFVNCRPRQGRRVLRWTRRRSGDQAALRILLPATKRSFLLFDSAELWNQIVFISRFYE